MSKAKKIKFIVGSTDVCCSKLWQVKFKRDDVYVMSDSGKYHKISLHASGVCHSAVTAEQMSRFNMTPEQRTAVRWTVLPDINEARVAFTILVAFSELRDQSARQTHEDSVLRIPTPPVSTAAVIHFVKARTQGKPIFWNLAPGIHLLHSEVLASGDTMSIIYNYTSAFNNLIQQCKGKLSNIASNIQPPAPLKLSSGFVTAFDSDGNPYYIELKL